MRGGVGLLVCVEVCLETSDTPRRRVKRYSSMARAWSGADEGMDENDDKNAADVTAHADEDDDKIADDDQDDEDEIK
ncbi:hypothetical protein Tco_0472711 [Tanacetum coccineum]